MLALVDLLDGVLVECPVGVVLGIMLEEVLSPVVITVDLTPNLVGDDRDELVALDLGSLTAIEHDGMSKGLQHLGELQNLHRVGA